jgi:hypothetical protein
MSVRGSYRHIGEGDKIGSDNSAFSVLIWNWFATRLEGKPKGLIPGRRIISTCSGVWVVDSASLQAYNAPLSWRPVSADNGQGN